MEPRICDGDVIIIRKQETADSGDIVIASVNGTDATCKVSGSRFTIMASR